jgi:ATP-binding cassette subfamily B protein
MADAFPPRTGNTPMDRILKILRLDRDEIFSVYLYAVLSGLIQLSLPLGIQSIISFVLGGSISTSLVILIVLVVLGVFFTGMVQIKQMRIIEKVQQKLFVRYAFEYAYRIPRLDLKKIDSLYLPETVNRFMDTMALQKGISKLLLEFPTATIQIFFGLILLSFYHPFFIAFSFLVLALVIAILYYTGARGLQTSIVESDYKYGVVAWLEELARVVSSFKFAKVDTLNLQRTDGLVSGYIEARTGHFRILQFQYWILVFLKVVITAIMLIVGSFLLIDQQLNLGQFIAAEIVILLVLNSVEKLIINLDKVYDVLTSVEKLSKIVDKPMEPNGEVPVPESSEGMRVTLKGVGMSFADKPVLRDVDFEVAPGTKVAVIGKDGSGKSTLLRLMSGMYSEHSGLIMIDNIPMSDYVSSSYRRQTGMLLSQQDIFQGTLLENITMGDEDIHPGEVIALIQKIGLEDFLKDNNFSFSTVLDPLGRRLSRSVVQKILLLRALINDPRLLLLEEPWRGMDTTNRARVIEYLLKGSGKTTVFVESNDRDFASQADRILYFRQGRLMYDGPWQEGIMIEEE